MERPVQLNPQQKKAVESIDGPLLVLAGAGAGKTRVIVERIKEIIRRGASPSEVLAITFTNKAASEMRSRLPAPGIERGPFVSTFHSLGLTLIKENRKLLGFKRTPTIYDRGDSLREIKRALKEVHHEDLEPRMALSLISRNKGEGVDAGAFAEAAATPIERAVAAAWLVYEKGLRQEEALDFDDLLLRAVEVLKHSGVREHYQRQWRYIHVDEYQDTNTIQERLIELLVGKEKNLCVVGDVDQTIYGWRGAQIENMLQFEKKYGAEVVILEENYRSTKAILAAANHLIGHNNNRPEKNLFTKNNDGDLLSLYIAGDGGDEAQFVVRTIGEKVREGQQPQDFAVLYRANFQSRALEEKFLEAGIPYQVLGTRFFERREVKDALSFIKAALYETPVDVARVANVPPRGIGKVTLLKLLSGQPAGEKVAAFKQILAKIKIAAETLTPAELVTFVIRESGMERAFKEDKLEGGERLENLRELVSLASRHANVEEFLEASALASDQDELKEDRNQVRLMTVHAAKGLEFPYVFIVGLEEGLFPYEREGEREGALEEERRLMYVALTRAQKKVYLSYAMMRTIFGSTDMRQNSQFLTELPGELLHNEVPERLGKTIYLD